MDNIQNWKLASDILLLLSLAYICYRLSRGTHSGPNPRQLLELETSLRALIQDADTQGRSLNQQLSRKQENLQKLLIELETTESRLNRSITQAEEKLTNIEIELSRTRKLSSAQANNQAPDSYEMHDHNPPRAAQQSYNTASYIAPEPPSFEAAAVAQPVLNRKSQASADYNIFGEPVKANSAYMQNQAQINAAQNLSASVEKEISRDKVEITNSFEELYYAAEEMLKAGRDLNYIAARTKLPLEEVKYLSELIRKKDKERKPIVRAEPEDTRLGVLAGMKRQVQVL